jgi:nucleolar complex protein 3
MLFRALNLAFSSRVPSFAKPPPWRSAAFAKRLVMASFHFPPSSAQRALGFAASLFAKEPKLESLLSTEDRIADGIYRPDVDDPQLCNPFATSMWELHELAASHTDPVVRRLASELAMYKREGQ